MVVFAQAVSFYFFEKQPKQLFVGAELCARCVQLLKGDPRSEAVERVISYSQEAQEVFSWVLAGRALSTLTGRLTSCKWDLDTVSALSEFLAYSASCGDIIVNKLFESKVPQFKVLGFATDTLCDMIDLKAGVNGLLSDRYNIVVVVKAIASVIFTIISTQAHFGAPSVRPQLSLVVETTVFISKFIHFNIEFSNK